MLAPPPEDVSTDMPGRGAALVTGATGFVGSHVAASLAAAGWSVRCTVRPTSDTSWLNGLPVERVVARLERDEEVAAAATGIDVVVHAAGITRARREEDYLAVNALGTERLARASIASGVSRFILVSSLAARGPDRPGLSADAPVSSYGRSKLEAEFRLQAVRDEAPDGPHTVILRPGGIYGPRDRDLLPLFRAARHGLVPVPPGEGALQPIHVDDVAAAVRAALDRQEAPERPLPIAGPGVRTWREVAAALGQALGRSVRTVRLPRPVFGAAGAAAELVAGLAGRTPRFDRRRAIDIARWSWTCDLRPAEEELGWAPEVRLEDGLRDTAAWYVERGWLES